MSSKVGKETGTLVDKIFAQAHAHYVPEVNPDNDPDTGRYGRVVIDALPGGADQKAQIGWLGIVAATCWAGKCPFVIDSLLSMVVAEKLRHQPIACAGPVVLNNLADGTPAQIAQIGPPMSDLLTKNDHLCAAQTDSRTTRLAANRPGADRIIATLRKQAPCMKAQPSGQSK
ncbi:hypothetical protein M1523_01225 [Patescibacteria group bacterium]|nr:hypothetical protein [Patescibacteria group bacterium]MCL5091196.1 hypothetical protein [Patescibacteria group bacterium]